MQRRYRVLTPAVSLDQLVEIFAGETVLIGGDSDYVIVLVTLDARLHPEDAAHVFAGMEDRAKLRDVVLREESLKTDL